jgi:predicted helicase
MIQAESQAVLSTLTEHDFQYAFKKMTEALGTSHTRGRGLF